MLIQLLRTYLRPYQRLLILVVILSLIGTMAALYLPNLNAAIIDNGVAKGDTSYIWHTGMVMLGVAWSRSAARSLNSFGQDRDELRP
jgi:ATP-binding cassette subfamily B protein